MVYDEITPTVGSKQPASGYVTSLPDFLVLSLYPIWLPRMLGQVLVWLLASGGAIFGNYYEVFGILKCFGPQRCVLVHCELFWPLLRSIHLFSDQASSDKASSERVSFEKVSSGKVFSGKDATE